MNEVGHYGPKPLSLLPESAVGAGLALRPERDVEHSTALRIGADPSDCIVARLAWARRVGEHVTYPRNVKKLINGEATTMMPPFAQSCRED
jgi:hypothetical protein